MAGAEGEPGGDDGAEVPEDVELWVGWGGLEAGERASGVEGRELAMDAIWPLIRGWASSLRRLGPAEVVKLIPKPMMRRPPMNIPFPWAALWSAAPATQRREPKAMAGRLPYLSAMGDAKKAPTKPPTKTMAVMRPMSLDVGLPMAEDVSKDWGK